MMLVSLGVDNVWQDEVVVKCKARRWPELLPSLTTPPPVDFETERVFPSIFGADHEESHGCHSLCQNCSKILLREIVRSQQNISLQV